MDEYSTNVDVDGDGTWDEHETYATDDGAQLITADMNHDGVVDFVAVDENGDGIIEEAAYDDNYDGTLDTIHVDTTGDGYLDTSAPLTEEIHLDNPTPDTYEVPATPESPEYGHATGHEGDLPELPDYGTAGGGDHGPIEPGTPHESYDAESSPTDSGSDYSDLDEPAATPAEEPTPTYPGQFQS